MTCEQLTKHCISLHTPSAFSSCAKSSASLSCSWSWHLAYIVPGVCSSSCRSWANFRLTTPMLCRSHDQHSQRHCYYCYCCHYEFDDYHHHHHHHHHHDHEDCRGTAATKAITNTKTTATRSATRRRGRLFGGNYIRNDQNTVSDMW